MDRADMDAYSTVRGGDRMAQRAGFDMIELHPRTAICSRVHLAPDQQWARSTGAGSKIACGIRSRSYHDPRRVARGQTDVGQDLRQRLGGGPRHHPR